jgi:hypothetical protein
MSSAVKIARYLLVQHPGLAAAVPPNSIGTGRFTEGSALPAIIVSHVFSSRRPVRNQDGTEFCTARIQVTVFAKSYPEQDAVQKLVRTALPETRGVVDGVNLDNIQPGGDGPDLRDDIAGIYIGTSDFIVTFNE